MIIINLIGAIACFIWCKNAIQADNAAQVLASCFCLCINLFGLAMELSSGS